MKKYNLIYWCLLLILSSCDYGEVEKYKDDFAPGGTVMGIVVSPATQTLYVDSEFPDLIYYCIPSNAGDTTVTWSSSLPDVLDIDPKTGKMFWGTPRNAEVIISATSIHNPEARGTCTLTISNTRGKYRYLDFRSSLGLWVLDRNLGATKPFESRDQINARGNFYQYGRNAVVSNFQFGGENGKGGSYWYVAGSSKYEIFGGYPAFDLRWDPASPEAIDWTKPENTPCPPGWRLPTKADLDKIAYMTNEKNFVTQKEKAAAKLLRKKLLFGSTGRCNRSNFFNQANSYWWSSAYNAEKKTVWALEVKWSGDEPLPPTVVEMDFKAKDGMYGIGYEAAMPIRAVKDGAEEAE